MAALVSVTALLANVTRLLGVLGQGGTPSCSLTVRDVSYVKDLTDP